MVTIGIIGLGFVGGAMEKSFNNKIIENDLSGEYQIYCYDKYKSGGIGTFENILMCDMLFLALPTLYNNELKSYDYSAIYETCDKLTKNNFKGLVVIKSTLEPTITEKLSELYNCLDFVHNPEFLTARTAYEDFHNQHHIVLGKSKKCLDRKFDMLAETYSKLYPLARLSKCSSIESESMKIFCNTFYAVKIQYFNELYLLSQKIDADYNKIVEMMICNGWINPMHTNVPGPDGQLSYGGLCFPKDTNALLEFMKKMDTPCSVLNATIEERNSFRNDNANCK